MNDVGRKGAIKRFEVYRRENGRTGISRTLHHDPDTGRSWITEIHQKMTGAGLRMRETTTQLCDMDPEDRARYEVRLRKELAAEIVPRL